MKRIISIILILFSISPLFAQLQEVGAYRIANNSTAFGYPLSKGAKIFDATTGNIYTLLKSAKSTATLSGLIENTDYEQFLPLHGTADNSLKLNSFGTYYSGTTLNYIPTVYKDVNGYFGTEVGQYIDFHETAANDFNTRLISSGDKLYIANANTATNYLIWDENNMGTGSGLDADMLDGQHGSYYSNFNNLSGKDYLGMKNITAFTDTIAKAVYTKFTHFTTSDTTMVSGSMSYSAGDIIVGVSGNYEITYSFQLSNSETEPVLTFNINNGTTVLSSRQVATNAGERKNITIVTTAKLTAGAAISIQYTCSLAIAEYLTITDMNVFIEKK